MCRAWDMNRNASRARRTSHARTGNRDNSPAAIKATTRPSICPEPLRPGLTQVERPVRDPWVLLRQSVRIP